MKVAAETIEEFFVAGGEREPELREIDELIQKTLPGIDRKLYVSPTFVGIAYGSYRYQYGTGKEGDWSAIMLTPQKNYISLYIMAIREGDYLAEMYGKKLGKVSTGKSCICFKKADDLNLTEIKNILRDAGEWLKEQPKSQV